MLKTSTRFVSRTNLEQVNQFNPVTTTLDRITLDSWREGVQNPGYKGKIAQHVDATTPLTAFSEDLKIQQVGRCAFVESGYWRSFSTKGGFQLASLRSFSTLPSPASEANAKAAADFYEQLKKIRTDFAGQQILGELGKTISGLRSPFKAGVDILLHALQKAIRVQKANQRAKRYGPRKGPAPQPSLNGVRRVTRNIGGQWLEIRFSLLPVIADVEGILTALRRKASGIDVRSYKAFGLATNMSMSHSTSSDVYGVTYMADKMLVRASKVYYHFGYMHKALNDIDARIAAFEAGTLDIRDLPSTAWELTPFSWLIDYWLNIGSIIEAAFADVSNVNYVSKSVIDEYSHTIHVHTPQSLALRYVVTDFAPWVCSFTSRNVTRSSGPVGIPPLVVTRPRSNIQLLNVAALLAGSLTSVRK